MTKLLCKNPNDEVKYMTRVQSWSSPRLIDQFQCLSTSKHINKHVHMYMYTHYTFTCTLISSLSTPLPFLLQVYNMITYQQKGEQSLETILQNTDPSSITSIERETHQQLLRKNPCLYTHPYLSIHRLLSEMCTRRVSHVGKHRKLTTVCVCAC